MNNKILVIGATGLVGKAVANQLNNEGYQVIVMSSNKNKAQHFFNDDFEIIEADVLKTESIKYSFHGIDGVYISLPEKDAQKAISNILEAAKAANVKQLIYTSGCTVKKENAWHPMIKAHHIAENAIEKSGIPFTIFKLTMIMNMIPRYANNGKPFIIGKQVHGWSWIHTSDIAKMAANAFRNPKALNKKLSIFGNEKSTIIEAVNQYNQKFHPQVKAAKPKPYWISNLLALFIGEKLKYAISIFKYFEDHPEEGNTEVTYQILGKPQMTLNQYFEELNHGVK